MMDSDVHTTVPRSKGPLTSEYPGKPPDPSSQVAPSQKAGVICRSIFFARKLLGNLLLDLFFFFLLGGAMIPPIFHHLMLCYGGKR